MNGNGMQITASLIFDRFRSAIGLLIAGLLVTACGGAIGGPRVWIDDPLPGANLPLEPVIVQSTSAAEGGVAQVSLQVNGEMVRTDIPAGEAEDLISLGQPWNPPAPGSYNLRVVAEAADGTTASSRTVTVNVGQATRPASQPPTEQQSPTSQVTPTSTATKLPPTKPSPITINFNADDYSITVGQCTTLRWAVENADEVTYEGEPVLALEAEQVCPTVTTTYNLAAANAGAEANAAVTIEVLAQPPAAPAQLSLGNGVCNGNEYKVELIWQDQADNEDGYRIYRDGSQIAELGPDSQSYTDEPPGSGPYTYGVEAFNQSGASARATVKEGGCLY